MLQPLHLWSHAAGPNPWKVAILLEEMELPYETEFLDMAHTHALPYEKINPNGRVPALRDPNTDITLWESGAIVNYLITTYDKEGRFSPTDTKDKFLCQQWLFFQASGQGPYFGQYSWFKRFHSEQLPSAQERYLKEVFRVTKVLDVSLTGKEYLVAGKCTYADLSFITWYTVMEAAGLMPDLKKENPHFAAWIERLYARPAVSKVLADRVKAMSGGK